MTPQDVKTRIKEAYGLDVSASIDDFEGQKKVEIHNPITNIATFQLYTEQMIAQNNPEVINYVAWDLYWMHKKFTDAQAASYVV